MKINSSERCNTVCKTVYHNSSYYIPFTLISHSVICDYCTALFHPIMASIIATQFI